jgi:hypothetical protein
MSARLLDDTKVVSFEEFIISNLLKSTNVPAISPYKRYI